MVNISNKILNIGIVLLCIIGLIDIVLAYGSDLDSDYVKGIITINGTLALGGTNYTVTVITGSNVGYYYNGSVDDIIPIFNRGNGYYDTDDQVYFNTSDGFVVTVPGFSQNRTGTFIAWGNDNVNLDIFYPENLPPTTTFNSSSTNISSSNGWYNRSVNVTLFPIDNPRVVGSGVQATYYNVSGTGQQSGTNFIVSSEGNNTITYYSVDNNGSVETTNTIYMNLDKTAPVVTIYPVTSPTNTTSQTINGTYNETGSGIATIYVGSVLATLSGNNYSASVTLAEGTNTIYVNATDNASNRGTNITTIIRDMTAPVVRINAVTSPVNATSQTINGSFIETGTGIASINVSGVTATINGNNYSATVPLIEGTNTIYVNATDNMTNVGTNSTTIVRDTISPATSNIVNSTPTSVSVTITWTTNENATSVVKYNTTSGNLNFNSSNSTLTTSHSISLTGLLSNTTYYYVVNSTDEAGNTNQSAELNFTTADAPVVTIILPSDTIYNSSTITLNATFGGQNVSYTWYKPDNNANSTSQSNRTFLNSTLTGVSDGHHNITVYANDSSGALGQSTRHFFVDITPPAVTINSVTSPTNATSQTINGSFVETGSGISTVVVNGVTATITGTNYSASVPLTTEGTNTIIVNATDNASNVGNNSATIVRDRTAPVVTINSVTSPTNFTSQTINGSFVETVSGISTVLVNGVTATITGTNYSASVTLIIEGSNTIIVNATDNASNVGNNSATIVLDTTAPVVTINTVTSPTNATSQTINGSFVEAGSGISTVLVNGVTATLNGNNYSASVTLSAEGTNTIYVNATDNVSNTGTNSTTIVRDTIAPVVTINTVTSPVNATSQIINGTYSETGSGIASVIVNGVTATLSGNNYSVSVPLTVEGTNTIYANAIDNASNVGTNSTTIVRDTTPPVISNITNSTPSSNSVTIAWNTSEAATSLVKYNTSSGNLNYNSSNSTLTTSHSITLTGLLANTTYYYVVNSTDAAGNTNQSAENNFMTAAAPTVIISSPQDTTYNTSTISLNASFGGQNVSYAWYKQDGGVNSTASANVVSLNATLSGLSEGLHNVTVYANDSAGYMGQSTVNFTVDTVGPVISSVSSVSTNSNSSTITWTTDEAATSVVKYGTSSTNLDMNVSNISRVTSHSITLTGLLQNTTYYYAVNSTDAVENSNQSSPVSQFTTWEVYGSVNGTITDVRLGTTIANVTIVLYNASGGTYTATSESNGAYIFTNIITNFSTPYVYAISACKTNYTINSSLTVTVVNSTTSNTINITLRAYNGTFRGTIIKNGTSIEIGGARVNITNNTLGSVIVTTDAAGSYSASVYPARYDSITVSKAGYLNWTVNNETVISNETHTVTTVSLSPNTVTVTANRTVGSADSGQNVSFNLTIANTGDDATFNVVNTSTNVSTIVTTNPSTLILNSTTSTGYVVIIVNNINPGGWPVTITISNGSKSASVTLNTIMRNASANYTNITSIVDTSSSVTGATLVNTTVQNNATVSGNSTLIMNATVTGEDTQITDGAVIRGDFGNSYIDNSSVGNATVVSSNLTGSTISGNASVSNSTLAGAIVGNSTLTNVTVRSDSTITNVANLRNITLWGVDVNGDPTYEYEGRITGGTGWATYHNINFTLVYDTIRISQLVIEQGPNTIVGSGTNFSINDTSLGTSMNFSMIVNLSNPAVINISETGISPDGAGFSSGTRLGNFLYIRSNDTNPSNVTTHILRLFFDIDPSTYTGGVVIYYYNTSAATPAWQALTTTGSGTEGGRYYIEARPDHFSTFALLGTTTTTTTTTPSSGGSGSGGGGLVTSEPYDNIAKSERYDKSLIANKSVTYTFKEPELGIYEIAITGKENENDIALRVEVLKGTSKLVSVQAPGIVYKNVNVWAGSKKITEAVIRFKILNSWFTENGIDASEIKLVKWDGSNWVQLETLQKKKDTTYVYYEAKTDTFSHFAITGMKGGVSTQTVVSPTPSEATKPVSVPTEVPVEKKSNGFEAIYLFVGILAVAYMLRRK